ncbi:MAG TPA: hypothetical protein VHY09_06665, partial [Candidatus Methylacidiphilales bacterium]|nr:hypothetical protein [Candidatus Methylacidiphilales bacterium]
AELMEDRELRKLLLETCPVRPGQEDRAWAALRERLYAKPALSGWRSLLQPTWRNGALAGVAFGLVIGAVVSFVVTSQSQIFATADSQAPGIYATSFYSKSAQAQVVWLNGMEPASDKPTFLEKTGQVANPPANSSAPAGDPNSL